MGYSRECYPASTAAESGRRFRYKVSSVHVMLLKKVYKTKGMLTWRWGTQIGEVACGRSPHPSFKRDQIKMRDYMDRWVTPPKRVTSPTSSPHLLLKRP